MTNLDDIIAAESRAAAFPAARIFADHLAERYGSSVAAVLFYGSCLRQGTDVDLMLDFYVLVDRMGAAIRNPLSAFFGALLPPNVYYIELPYEGRILRAKVAVMSVAAFIRGTSSSALTSAIWARFSQRTIIMRARTDEVRRRLEAALVEAVRTMMAATAPLLPRQFVARDLWVRALQETYRAELRPEPPEKAAELVDEDFGRYRAITTAIYGDPPNQSDIDSRAPLRWLARRILGKSMNVLRLVKAAFTFQGGLDYAVWKIERHSGVKIELTDAERRRPLLTGARLLLRTLKSGGLK